VRRVDDVQPGGRRGIVEARDVQLGDDDEQAGAILRRAVRRAPHALPLCTLLPFL
jgi:hypothetical protein